MGPHQHGKETLVSCFWPELPCCCLWKHGGATRRARPWLCTPCSSVFTPSGAMASSTPQLQPPTPGLGLRLLARGSADPALVGCSERGPGGRVGLRGAGCWRGLGAPRVAGWGRCFVHRAVPSCPTPRSEMGTGQGQVSVTVGLAHRGRSVLGALAAGASLPGSRALSAPQTSALPFPSQGPPRMQAWEPRWGMRSVCFHGDGHDIR